MDLPDSTLLAYHDKTQSHFFVEGSLWSLAPHQRWGRSWWLNPAYWRWLEQDLQERLLNRAVAGV